MVKEWNVTNNHLSFGPYWGSLFQGSQESKKLCLYEVFLFGLRSFHSFLIHQEKHSSVLKYIPVPVLKAFTVHSKMGPVDQDPSPVIDNERTFSNFGFHI